ncbi:hypothetical protein BaRGS_00035286, partial [Batillaria attramentaria]
MTSPRALWAKIYKTRTLIPVSDEFPLRAQFLLITRRVTENKQTLMELGSSSLQPFGESETQKILKKRIDKGRVYGDAGVRNTIL